MTNDYTRHDDLSGAIAVLDGIRRPTGVRVLRGDPELCGGLHPDALRRLADRSAVAPSGRSGC